MAKKRTISTSVNMKQEITTLQSASECITRCERDDSFMCLSVEWEGTSKKCRLYNDVASQSMLAVDSNIDYYEVNIPRTCEDVALRGGETSGKYLMRPKQFDTSQHTNTNLKQSDSRWIQDPATNSYYVNLDAYYVFCDLSTPKGPWTVIQRHSTPTSFDKDWNSYKQGFGLVTGDFWIGNEKLHQITSSGRYQLRLDICNSDGECKYATYNNFFIEG
jgi:hypothetical protein